MSATYTPYMKKHAYPSFCSQLMSGLSTFYYFVKYSILSKYNIIYIS
jgi:hypothetical protein